MFNIFKKSEDKDFKVEIPHFYCMEYIEGDHKMIIDMDFRDPELEISIIDIKSWNPPYQNEEISKEKKQQILINVYKYLIQNKMFEKITINKG